MKKPARIAHLDGSSWTSVVERDGWRHFHVVEVARSNEGWQVTLAASCDVHRRVVVSARELLEKDGWSPGWLRL